MEGAFQSWRGSRGEAPTPITLERVEDDGALVLAFTRPGGSRVALVTLTALEGSSFFAEGLEDPSDDVEDWLTDANTIFSDKSQLALGQALDILLARAPRKLGLDSGASEAPDSPMGGDDDDEVELDDDDDDRVMIENIQAGAERNAQRTKVEEEEQWSSLVSASASQGSRQASQVLMREMRNLMALQGSGDTGGAKAVEVEMVDDSLFHWSVQMHADNFPANCSLHGELKRFGTQHPSGVAAVVMDVLFPPSYPMEPPFIRVVRPRFQMHTGHITVGGSVCMQLLTPSGWLPSVALESVFVAIRSEMIEGGGRLDFANSRDYSAAEAREAFNRVAERYGWKKA